jgi:hypothetical protein
MAACDLPRRRARRGGPMSVWRNQRSRAMTMILGTAMLVSIAAFSHVMGGQSAPLGAR